VPVNFSRTVDSGTALPNELKLPFKFRTSYIFRVGMERNMGEKNTVRVGYFYDHSPVKDISVGPLFPDSSRSNLTIGASHIMGNKEFSMFYQAMWVLERTTDVSENNKVFTNGTYSSFVHLLGMGMRIRLGEGLAAGMGSFSLSQGVQEKSYPAQMAAQMGTLLVQPVIQPPGIGNVPGITALPPRIPGILQTTVRRQGNGQFPLFVTNLSVPGLHLAEAISRRPKLPLIYRNDSLQTSINLILGFPALVIQTDGQNVPLWSQIEYAQNMFPTLALVELGYYDVLEAAVNGDLTLLPDVTTFRTNYSQIVSSLRRQFADVIVSTIPDPMTTAYFSAVLEATRTLRTQPFIILGLYDVTLSDYLTIPGVNEISLQFLDRKIQPLSAGSVLRRATADAISARVKALNAVISEIAQQNGAVVHDMYGLFSRVDSQGISVSGRALTSDYLGGFYLMNGYYPGITGHALIANDVLDTLNRQFGTNFQHVDPTGLLASDPAANSVPVYQLGPEFALDDLLPGLIINGSPVSAETVTRLRSLAPPASNSKKTDKSFPRGISR
jgi:hypothetical protein